MDTVERRAEVHRAGAERIVLIMAFHHRWQALDAGAHLRRGDPVRPLFLRGDLVHARPLEAGAADADAVAAGHAAFLDQIQTAFLGVDDDLARLVLAGERHGGALDAGDTEIFARIAAGEALFRVGLVDRFRQGLRYEQDSES